ncbi:MULTISPECIES: hypothetical protein [unclassified Rhizobium]|uniref:hypothetical protein n=1 Tax=unclassified Rhizobium TaxID=2613769 RepID=UPI00288BE726|nr:MULTISPECIES: hypothetical protein [unclassified Rhizobium]
MVTDTLEKLRQHVQWHPDAGYAPLIKEAIRALESALSTDAEPVAWIYEDELPAGYPYDLMFKHSKVDGVRMFPIFGPPQPAPSVAALPDVGKWTDDDRSRAWLGAFDTMHQRAMKAEAELSARVQDVGLSRLGSSYAFSESPGVKSIAAERRRQIEKEGWTPTHDDKYTNGELLEAAACYALHNGMDVDDAPGAWPWPKDWWKPTNRQRDLEKAGALIAAELDRVIRAAAPAAKLEEKP